MLTGAIVAPVAPPVDREIAVLLFVVAICCCCCCCFRGAATLAMPVDFVVCCGGVAADTKGGFTVLAIPHIRASVVLTTLRLGLVGSHIFDLSSDEIGLLSELPAGGDDADNVGEDDCCANTWVLLQIPKTNMPTRTENSAKIELVLLILNI